MTVYGPDISEALAEYATQFDDVQVQERTPIIDLNAIHPLSYLREQWTNVTSNETEHNLSTAAGTDEIANLETVERGQYTAGYQAQAGMGVRVPTSPSNDEVLRWGYFTVDANNEPLDGWYFGVDSDGTFVCEVRNSTQRKVYQSDWNVNTATGTSQTDVNTDEFNLDLAKGNIFQIEFVYYGYGPVEFQVLTDDGKLTLHKFTHDGQTSIENTNLPIRAHIDSGGTNADAMDLFVGGRQFSIVGQRSTNERRAGHYRDSLSGVDDTQWYPVVSARLKDGTDVGSIDFTHVLASVLNFEIDTDNTGYRWQIRRGAVPDNPSWETPSSHTGTQDETAMKVDTNSTSIDDGSGTPTGVFVDGGTLSAGGNNALEIQQEDSSGNIVGEQVVSLVVQAVPGGSGTVSEAFFNWEESW